MVTNVSSCTKMLAFEFPCPGGVTSSNWLYFFEIQFLHLHKRAMPEPIEWSWRVKWFRYLKHLGKFQPHNKCLGYVFFHYYHRYHHQSQHHHHQSIELKLWSLERMVLSWVKCWMEPTTNVNPVPWDLFMECQIKTTTGETTSSWVPLSNCVQFLHNFVEHIKSGSHKGLMDTTLRELE